MLQRLRSLAHEIVPENTAARRYLHQHLELSWQEKGAAAFILKFLTPLNLKIGTTDSLHCYQHGKRVTRRFFLVPQGTRFARHQRCEKMRLAINCATAIETAIASLKISAIFK